MNTLLVSDSAISLFGEEKEVRADIFGALLNRCGGLSPAAVEEMNQEHHGLIDKIRSGTAVPDDTNCDDILSLLADLEIPLDSVLHPYPPMTDEQTAFWSKKLKASKEGRLASSRLDADLDPEVELLLFAMLTAMKELF